jgi:hypothetical protein
MPLEQPQQHRCEEEEQQREEQRTPPAEEQRGGEEKEEEEEREEKRRGLPVSLLVLPQGVAAALKIANDAAAAATTARGAAAGGAEADGDGEAPTPGGADGAVWAILRGVLLQVATGAAEHAEPNPKRFLQQLAALLEVMHYVATNARTHRLVLSTFHTLLNQAQHWGVSDARRVRSGEATEPFGPRGGNKSPILVLVARLGWIICHVSGASMWTGNTRPKLPLNLAPSSLSDLAGALVLVANGSVPCGLQVRFALALQPLRAAIVSLLECKAPSRFATDGSALTTLWTVARACMLAAAEPAAALRVAQLPDNPAAFCPQAHMKMVRTLVGVRAAERTRDVRAGLQLCALRSPQQPAHHHPAPSVVAPCRAKAAPAAAPATQRRISSSSSISSSIGSRGSRGSSGGSGGQGAVASALAQLTAWSNSAALHNTTSAAAAAVHLFALSVARQAQQERQAQQARAAAAAATVEQRRAGGALELLADAALRSV